MKQAQQPLNEQIYVRGSTSHQGTRSQDLDLDAAYPALKYREYASKNQYINSGVIRDSFGPLSSSMGFQQPKKHQIANSSTDFTQKGVHGTKPFFITSRSELNKMQKDYSQKNQEPTSPSSNGDFTKRLLLPVSQSQSKVPFKQFPTDNIFHTAQESVYTKTSHKPASATFLPKRQINSRIQTTQPYSSRNQRMDFHTQSLNPPHHPLMSSTMSQFQSIDADYQLFDGEFSQKKAQPQKQQLHLHQPLPSFIDRMIQQVPKQKSASKALSEEHNHLPQGIAAITPCDINQQQGTFVTESIINEREDLFIKKLGDKMQAKSHIEVAELIELQRIYETRPAAIPVDFIEKCHQFHPRQLPKSGQRKRNQPVNIQLSSLSDSKKPFKADNSSSQKSIKLPTRLTGVFLGYRNYFDPRQAKPPSPPSSLKRNLSFPSQFHLGGSDKQSSMDDLSNSKQPGVLEKRKYIARKMIQNDDYFERTLKQTTPHFKAKQFSQTMSTPVKEAMNIKSESHYKQTKRSKPVVFAKVEFHKEDNLTNYCEDDALPSMLKNSRIDEETFQDYDEDDNISKQILFSPIESNYGNTNLLPTSSQAHQVNNLPQIASIHLINDENEIVTTKGIQSTLPTKFSEAEAEIQEEEIRQNQLKLESILNIPLASLQEFEEQQELQYYTQQEEQNEEMAIQLQELGRQQAENENEEEFDGDEPLSEVIEDTDRNLNYEDFVNRNVDTQVEESHEQSNQGTVPSGFQLFNTINDLTQNPKDINNFVNDQQEPQTINREESISVQSKSMSQQVNSIKAPDTQQATTKNDKTSSRTPTTQPEQSIKQTSMNPQSSVLPLQNKPQVTQITNQPSQSTNKGNQQQQKDQKQIPSLSIQTPQAKSPTQTAPSSTKAAKQQQKSVNKKEQKGSKNATGSPKAQHTSKQVEENSEQNPIQTVEGDKVKSRKDLPKLPDQKKTIEPQQDIATNSSSQQVVNTPSNEKSKSKKPVESTGKETPQKVNNVKESFESTNKEVNPSTPKEINSQNSLKHQSSFAPTGIETVQRPSKFAPSQTPSHSRRQSQTSVGAGMGNQSGVGAESDQGSQSKIIDIEQHVMEKFKEKKKQQTTSMHGVSGVSLYNIISESISEIDAQTGGLDKSEDQMNLVKTPSIKKSSSIQNKSKFVSAARGSKPSFHSPGSSKKSMAIKSNVIDELIARYKESQDTMSLKDKRIALALLVEHLESQQEDSTNLHSKLFNQIKDEIKNLAHNEVIETHNNQLLAAMPERSLTDSILQTPPGTLLFGEDIAGFSMKEGFLADMLESEIDFELVQIMQKFERQNNDRLEEERRKELFKAQTIALQKQFEHKQGLNPTVSEYVQTGIQIESLGETKRVTSPLYSNNDKTLKNEKSKSDQNDTDPFQQKPQTFSVALSKNLPLMTQQQKNDLKDSYRKIKARAEQV